MNHPAGLSVYGDVPRKLCDIAELDETEHEWQPGNRAAQKLFRCVECLRDVLEILISANQSKATEKKRRKIKILFTPLNSLTEATLDLLNDIESNPSTYQHLQTGATKLVSQLRTRLREEVPFGKNGLLSEVRNKVAAHVDHSLCPNQARELIKKAELHKVGKWIDANISVLSDVLKLSIYWWTCDSPSDNVMRLISAEPFLVTFRTENEEIVELLAIHLITNSPRQDVFDLMAEVVSYSRWLFRPGDVQIRGFTLDGPNECWAQTLKRFPSSNS